MLPLTRPFRQALATVAVVALTIAPTGYVAWTAWKIQRPGHLRDVEVEMGRQLGLQVSLDGVRYPQPGEIEFRGLVLRQEEPRRTGLTEIARATSARLSKNGREVTLFADGLKLRADGPKQAMALVGALLQRSGDVPFDRVSLIAPEVVLDLTGEADNRPSLAVPLAYKIRDLAAMFEADRHTPHLSASYRFADDTSSNAAGSTRCELTLTRDRAQEPVQTTVAFKTMDGLPLPARVLDLFFESSEWLGPKARVQGSLTLAQKGTSDWSAEFSGDLIDVDLQSLFEKRFPNHQMSGRAKLSVATAKWGDRPGQGFGWNEARGEIATGPGAVSPGLLQALASQMRFQVGTRLPSAPRLDFQAMAMTFALTGDGEIRFGGALGAEYAPGVMMVQARAGQPSLAKVPDGAANVRGLLKALFPATAESLVPGLPESQKLSRYLPMPPAMEARASRTIEAN